MTRNLFAALTLIALAAGPARADEASGLALGLRTSYGVPLGEAGDGSSLRSLTTGAVPVQIEAGWRFDEHWLAGAYFAWGPTVVGGGARSALRAQGARDVSGHFEQRLGLQAIYTVLPDRRFAPWIGLAVGYEWTRYADAKLADGRETELGLGGPEATLQVGGDYRVAPRFSVGPFAAFSVGRYHSRLVWVEDGSDTTSSVNDRGTHGWIHLGVKGTFNL